MRLHPHPDNCRAAYDYLKTWQPYKGMRLPPSEEIEFRCEPMKALCGWYSRTAAGVHVLAFATNFIATHPVLLRYVAHEMIHLHQAIKGTENKSQHNAEFLRVARRVCDIHGFDPKNFV